MADLIVKSAVRNALDEMNVSSDFYDAINAEVQDLLDNAVRSRSNSTSELNELL